MTYQQFLLAGFGLSDLINKADRMMFWEKA